MFKVTIPAQRAELERNRKDKMSQKIKRTRKKNDFTVERMLFCQIGLKSG